MSHEFAVYAEHSDTNKKMVAGAGPYDGWNARVFNRTEVPPRGENISLDSKTGVVVLKRGVYHLTGCSLVTYFYPEIAGVPSQMPALGGYCRLRDAARPGCEKPETCLNEHAVAVGTMSTANMIPSLIDTYIEVTEPDARLVLEHQVGADVRNVYLQLFVVNSTWHVMARLSIQRL
jgi:hypothetical protein